MPRPSKKVAIKVYVPAGEYCRAYTYSCPLLMDSENTPATFCLLIPDSFEFNHGLVKKHKLCPSLLHNSNKLTDDEMKNERLRLVSKSIKHHTFDNLMYQIKHQDDDNNDNNETVEV
jgi:hypothetical protein